MPDDGGAALAALFAVRHEVEMAEQFLRRAGTSPQGPKGTGVFLFDR